MNFIWDIVLHAAQDDFESQQLFFKPTKSFSPYYEQSFSCINQRRVDTAEIEINPLMRFTSILWRTFWRNCAGFEQLKRDKQIAVADKLLKVIETGSGVHSFWQIMKQIFDKRADERWIFAPLRLKPMPNLNRRLTENILNITFTKKIMKIF